MIFGMPIWIVVITPWPPSCGTWLQVPHSAKGHHDHKSIKFVCVAMCSLVMSLCSHDVITIH